MRRLAATVLAALLAACGSSKSDPPKAAPGPVQKVGDPAGQRAFAGSFRNGANSGTCAVLVPPAATGAIATTGACSTGGAPVTLSGTYTAALVAGAPDQEVVVEGVTATGTLTITGTGPGGTWTITGSVGAGTTTGLGVLVGALSIGGGAPVTVVLSDGTVDPLTSYCGSYYTEAAPLVVDGSFILQVNSTVAQGVSASTDGSSGALLMGFRSSADVTLNGCDPSTCGYVGKGTISGSSISGDWRDPAMSSGWTAADRGLWRGTICPGATQASVTCCGSASKTRCCIGTGCTCTPAP